MWLGVVLVGEVVPPLSTFQHAEGSAGEGAECADGRLRSLPLFAPHRRWQSSAPHDALEGLHLL